MVTSDTIITDSSEVHPAGRGKVIIITKKHILKCKDKFGKKNPSFLHSIIRSNPESIKLKEYLQDGFRKRVILFPEGRILTEEERLDLGCSLLATCARVRYILPDTSGVGTPMKHTRNSCFIVTREMRKILNMKVKRYEAWRKRNM